MDRADSSDQICAFLALPFATPDTRTRVPKYWFQNIYEDGNGEAFYGRLIKLIETVAHCPVDPQVTQDTVNMWRRCPYTEINTQSITHRRSHLTMLTMLNVGGGSSDSAVFRQKSGSVFYDMEPSAVRKMEELIPRTVMLQLVFELAHVGISSIQNTSHLEHVWLNRIVRTAIMRAGEQSDVYKCFMHNNKEAFPEEELHLLCPHALCEWVRDWLLVPLDGSPLSHHHTHQ